MLISIDVGGTYTRIAASGDGRTIIDKKKFPTPKSFDECLLKIFKSIANLSSVDSIKGIAIGIPGIVDQQKGRTLRVTNLPSWDYQDIKKIFKTHLAVPVRLANDAELAALGEATFGAGKKFKIVAYLTVSTGIGGALVINKRLTPKVYNAEPGHTVIDINSTFADNIGVKGSVEALASGLAFEKRFGLKAEQCEDPKIWNEFLKSLGQAIINLMLLWSPQIFIIGGGFSKRRDLLFEPLRLFIEKNLKLFPPPAIVPAALGDDAGLYGGFALLKSET